MECTQLHNLRQHLFESLTEIVPAFANMNTDDKFRFIMISYDYDINKICIFFLLFNLLRGTLFTSSVSVHYIQSTKHNLTKH